MMDTSLGPKLSPLAAEWQTRLEDLRVQLRLQPQHPKAWQWRMEAKVLVFMLARYEKLASLNPLSSSPALFIARDALVGKVKERLSRFRRRQLLDDIEAKNKQHEAGFMDGFLEWTDTHIQNEINEDRKSKRNKNKRGYW